MVFYGTLWYNEGVYPPFSKSQMHRRLGLFLVLRRLSLAGLYRLTEAALQ